MADRNFRPMLSYGGGRGALAAWMAVIVPLFMVLIGIILASAAARTGQGEARGEALADLRQMRSNDEKDLALVNEKLKHVETLTAAEIDALVAERKRLESDAARPIDESRIWSYRKTGRVWTQWDGYRYEEIIDDGYLYHLPDDTEEVKNSSVIKRAGWPEERLKNVVWYPLYPIAGYIVKSVTGMQTHNALTLVAWSCLLGASVVIFGVLRRHFHEVLPDQHGRREGVTADAAATCAMALLLYGPASVFLYANYTESMFLLLLGLFIMMLQNRNWWGAAVIAGIASACRSQGVFFGPMLGVIYLVREDRKPIEKKLLTAAALGLISEIGLGCYVLYLQRTFHAPLAFMEAQKNWHVGINGETIAYALAPWHAIENFWDFAVTRPMAGRDADWPHIWESLCVFVPPIILVLGRRLLTLEFLLMGWVFWALPYVSQSMGDSNREDNCMHWMSMGRFMAVVLPLHMVVGTVMSRWKWLSLVMMAASAVGFAILAFRFGMRQWVG